MSDNFPNMPTDSALPEIGMYNPDPNTPNQDAGGASKIRASADAPHATEQVGYGYMTSEKDVQIDGTASGTTLPVASPITIETFGDPNNTGA